MLQPKAISVQTDICTENEIPLKKNNVLRAK